MVAAEGDRVLEVGAAAVGPGGAWWSSHQAKGRSHPSAAQVVCRVARAVRWASVKKRWVRPRSRTWEAPSRMAGRMPAPQASRRVSAAEIRSPVSRPAAAAWLRSLSWSRVMITVAATLPCSRSVGRCSSTSTNASPCRRAQSGPACGRVWAPRRRGEASCWMALRRIAPARVGTVKCPDTVPSWLSCRVSRVRSRAAVSSSASRASSWASTTATSRSTTSRARRAAGRSRTGSSRFALATRAASTRARSSMVRDAGSRAAVWAITVACAGDRAPEPRAAAVAGRSSSRAVARRTSRAASAPPARVCTASQALVPGIPASRATSALSAAARSLSFNACSRVTARSQSATRAAYPPAGSGAVLSRSPAGRRAGRRAGRGSRAPRPRPGGRCRGGGPGALTCLHHTRTHVRIR